jgi:hypothetical protein
LDEIIKVGDQLILVLANTPIEDEMNRTSILLRKRGVLELVEKQKKNLQSLEEIYQSRLSMINVNAPSFGETIEFMVADQIKAYGGPKFFRLQILTWKLLEGESAFSKLRIAACLALKSNHDSIEINHDQGYLLFRVPTKIQVREIDIVKENSIGEIGQKSFTEYDLTKASDLRRLLEKSKNQLQEIKATREKIVQYVLENISITDLV